MAAWRDTPDGFWLLLLPCNQTSARTGRRRFLRRSTPPYYATGYDIRGDAYSAVLQHSAEIRTRKICVGAGQATSWQAGHDHTSSQTPRCNRRNRRPFIRSPLAVSAVAAGLGMAAPAPAEIEEGKLVVWIEGDKGYDGLQRVGDWFTEET